MYIMLNRALGVISVIGLILTREGVMPTHFEDAPLLLFILYAFLYELINHTIKKYENERIKTNVRSGRRN